MPGRPIRATILVVEDDPAAARTLVEVLELADYRVWHAASGADARHQLELAQPDLILLDLILPDIDGLVLCTTLKTLARVPIVICSATVRRRDATLALKLGADDFIHKPFELEDLLARIEAILRRAPPRQELNDAAVEELRIGQLVIEPTRHSAILGKARLSLTPTEFRLLSALAARPEHIYSRNALAEAVWGYADASQGRTIDVHVRRLRVKLGLTKVPGPSIVSVRGSGYKLTGDDGAITAA